MHVFVLDKRKEPLTPCHPAMARKLLKSGRAVVVRLYPFTIRLKSRTTEESVVKPVRVKIDPGARFTGIAVVREDKRGEPRLVAGIELEHRGNAIRDAMTKRANYRRRRRSANTRYRAPRFDNRRRHTRDESLMYLRPEGWLAPSLRHRVETTMSWMRRLMRIAPVTGFSVESVKFDMQKMRNPGISGTEYQQGELAGYEMREYLLEKWGRKCAYCGAENTPLQVEHIIPRARGGSDRVSNLTLACEVCNQSKGARPIEEFLRKKPELLVKILAHTKAPLSSAAAVNSTRNALLCEIRTLGLPVETGSGGLTKYNRTRLGLPKSHVFDALCVGFVDSATVLTRDILHVRCTGRGQYSRTLPDKYGFPRVYLPRNKQFFGFATGDIVRAIVPKGKYKGRWTGRVAVRESGWFALSTGENTPDGKKERVNIKWDTCKILERNNGYQYNIATT